MKYCSHCGVELHDNAVMCVKCGCSLSGASQQVQQQPIDPMVSDKSGLVALLLCFFVGCLGIHRFYVGKVGSGIAQLLTCGGCGIWTLIDLIVIVMGNFTDSDGKKLKLQ